MGPPEKGSGRPWGRHPGERLARGHLTSGCRLTGRTTGRHRQDRAERADRATGDGRVRVAAADLAASCPCLPVTAVADALADPASRGLLGLDGDGLVPILPAGRWSPCG
jgi:hypothetical protein